MVQWVRIHLQMQRTWVRSLAWEDSTRRRAAKSNYRVHVPRACALQQEKPLQWKAHALQLESSPHSSQQEKARGRKTQGSQKEIN